MSAPGCVRRWEAEAARDGRLADDAREAYLLHAQRCADCRAEQRALDELRVTLRASSPLIADEMAVRRVRQNVLSAFNREVLRARPAFTASRGVRVGGLILLLSAAAALLLVARTRRPAPEPAALQLIAEPGARFVHERRANLEYVVLSDGTLELSFKRGLRMALLVRVPDGAIRDYGTVFRVSVREGRTQRIVVREGAVLLQRRGLPDRMVLAGEVFDAEPSVPSPAVLPAADLLESASAPPPTAAVASPDIAKKPAPRKDASSSKHHEHVAAVPAPADGFELQDRAYLRIVALLHEGRGAEARVAAQEYQRDFPDGFRRGEVERIASQPAR
jgi:hypothetical protein